MKNFDFNILYGILSGLVVCIPLAINLARYVTKAVREKNWPGLLDLVENYVVLAEQKFDNGADRKQWVLAMVQASAKKLNYGVDITVVGGMIDDLCKLSKKVNVAPAATN